MSVSDYNQMRFSILGKVYEVKKLKATRGSEGPGKCYELYTDDKLVCECQDWGDGGIANMRRIDDELFAQLSGLLKTVPVLEEKYCGYVESYLDEIVDNLKQLKNPKKTIVDIGNHQIAIWNAPYTKELAKAIIEKYKGRCIILNEKVVNGIFIIA